MSDATPLLITATLDPGQTPLVALRDVRERTLRHMEGLTAWLREPRARRVIFVKNCPLRIRHEALVRAAESHGKELEFVQVAPASRTALQGKGYGEGDLIRQALETSRLLRAADDFIKITGKLFMPDIRSIFTGEGTGEFFNTDASREARIFPSRRILKKAYQNETMSGVLAMARRFRVPWEWIAALPSGWIDTRCYRCEIGFYRKHLLNSHRRVQDSLGYTLENAVFDDLRWGEGIRRLHSPPMILGMSGSLGTYSGCFSDDIRHEASDLTEHLLSL